MTKTDKLHDSRVEQFRAAYGALQEAADLASRMAGPDGTNGEFLAVDVKRLQSLCRQAACRSQALDSTFDGEPR